MPWSNEVGSFNAATIAASVKGFYAAWGNSSHVYFVPYSNGSPHGNVLRYDLSGDFTNSASWSYFDAAGVNSALKGFTGAWGSASHVYFAPRDNGSPHGNVLRYDLSGDFTNAASWSYFDAAGVNSALKGFYAAWGTSSHIYFAPYDNGLRHGNVLRYDLSGDFTNAASWSYFDAAGVNAALKGFAGAWGNSSHVYFVPYDNGSPHGNVLRYDLSGDFTNSASWSYFDAAGVNSALKGFTGAWGSASHVYFAPRDNGSRHGNVLRYDLSGDFTNAASWSYFDAAGVNSALKGFYAAWGTSSHIYFAPYDNGLRHGNVLRYDLSGDFTNAASWSYFDAAGVNAALKGFFGAWANASHIYFAPYNNGAFHGNVLRLPVSSGGGNTIVRAFGLRTGGRR